MPSPRRLDELFPLGPNTDLYDTWPKLMQELEGRLSPLKAAQASFEAVTDQLLALSIDRFNEFLGPAVDRAQRVAENGFLLAHSSTLVTLTEGAPAGFTIQNAAERELFSPTPFVVIERTSTTADYAVARRDAWDRETGSLTVRVVAVFGAPGPWNDWVISAGSGVSAAIRQLASEALDVVVQAQVSQSAAETAATTATQARADAIAKAAEALASANAAAASATQANSSAGSAAAGAQYVQDLIASTGGITSSIPAAPAAGYYFRSSSDVTFGWVHLAGSEITTALGFTPMDTAARGASAGVAPLDAASLVPLANLPSVPTQLGFTPLDAAQKGAAGGVCELVGGLIPTNRIPAIALTDTTVVNTQADMLALAAQHGDVAIVSNDPASDYANEGTYILSGTDPTQLTHWTKLRLPHAVVTSVNGKAGPAVVIGIADISGLQAALDAKLAIADTSLTGRSVVNASDFAAIRQMLGLSATIPGGFGASQLTKATKADFIAPQLAATVIWTAGGAQTIDVTLHDAFVRLSSTANQTQPFPRANTVPAGFKLRLQNLNSGIWSFTKDAADTGIMSDGASLTSISLAYKQEMTIESDGSAAWYVSRRPREYDLYDVYPTAAVQGFTIPVYAGFEWYDISVYHLGPSTGGTGSDWIYFYTNGVLFTGTNYFSQGIFSPQPPSAPAGFANLLYNNGFVVAWNVIINTVGATYKVNVRRPRGDPGASLPYFPMFTSVAQAYVSSYGQGPQLLGGKCGGNAAGNQAFTHIMVTADNAANGFQPGSYAKVTGRTLN